MGTPDFASGVLDAILTDKHHEIVGVVTAVDKAAGRGMKIKESSVKQLAQTYGLPVFQPVKLRESQFADTLRSLNADVFVVVAFRMLPEIIWKIPPKGTINLHASLLPHYRGAAPINWAIINGETQTGVTTFFINENIDEGKILLREKVEITPDDNAGVLHDKLLKVGKQLLLTTLRQIEDGVAEPQHQSEPDVLKLAPKIMKEHCRIDWNGSAVRIYNFIRGLSPYPAAFSEYKDKNGDVLLLKIFSCETEVLKHSLPCGTIETDNKNFLKIACQDGCISVKELQVFGKKRMSVRDFLLGNKTMHDVILF
jgi:methionyl-tRNA formyltransferase